jgi:hypothetical protein
MLYAMELRNPWLGAEEGTRSQYAERGRTSDTLQEVSAEKKGAGGLSLSPHHKGEQRRQSMVNPL